MSILSIIIPCFNEAENLNLLLGKFSKIINDIDVQIILVNNGSTDNTNNILKDLKLKYPFFETIEIPKNKGYGYGLINGLLIAEGNYIGWTHADLQTDPFDVVRAYEILLKNPNKNIFIKGSRINRKFSDRIFSIFMSIFESILFLEKFSEINAQPTIFSRNLLKEFKSPPNDFSFDLFAYLKAKKAKYEIIRFNVDFLPRHSGISKWNINWKEKIKFILRTLTYSFKLKFARK